jgi:hypothetical protein
MSEKISTVDIQSTQYSMQSNWTAQFHIRRSSVTRKYVNVRTTYGAVSSKMLELLIRTTAPGTSPPESEFRFQQRDSNCVCYWHDILNVVC